MINIDLTKEIDVQKIHEGQKVKIKMANYDWQADELSDQFKKFIDENKDTVFTTKKYKYNLWAIEEDKRWLFHANNLIVVE